ncbi:hypothetical protein BDF22DRAFT_745403 [Syncephalis plumigaleata]|nr:hypothetical protein BDF22DRAFT_745403 [Syncephalis plumigaleata]
MFDHLTREDIPREFGKYRGTATTDRMKNSMRAAERVRPPVWSRALHVGSIVLCAGLVGYSVLFANYGTEEHCFTGLRHWIDDKRQAFWSLSEEEKEQLRARGVIVMNSSTSGLTHRTTRSTRQTNGTVADRARTTVRSYAEEQLERQQLNRTWKRVISVICVVIGLIVARQANVLDVLTQPALYSGVAFYIGALAILMVVGTYIEIRWLRGWRTGDPRPGNFTRWQERYPKEISLATGASSIGAISWIIAFWPIWGGWTIPVLFLLVVGINSAIDLLLV